MSWAVFEDKRFSDLLRGNQENNAYCIYLNESMIAACCIFNSGLRPACQVLHITARSVPVRHLPPHTLRLLFFNSTTLLRGCFLAFSIIYSALP